MSEDLKKLSLPIAIVTASLVLGLCVVFSAVMISRNIEKASSKLHQELLNEIKALQKTKDRGNRPEENFKPGEKIVEGVTAGSNPIMGNPAAPVLMVEFSDFKCPFSKKFYQQTFPQIDKEYIATGKVKFAYRDFPLGFHEFAKEAAIASRCAGKQNKFWQMFDSLSHSDQIDPGIIKNYAKELGLNMKTFDSCLTDNNIAAEVEKDLAESLKLGVRGTPAFFINGRFVEGARSFVTFKEIIEKELNNSDNKK